MLLEKQLVPWAEKEGLRYVSRLDVDRLREFRASWVDNAVSAKKRLGRLRSFFRFAKDSSWVEENPAKLIPPPNTTPLPTLPFTRDETARSLAACDVHRRKKSLGQGNRARIKAFVLLLRYSGLRLQNATTLEVSRLQGTKLFLYAQEARTRVSVPLPPFVVKTVTSIREASDDRFFWSGVGLPRSCMSVWVGRSGGSSSSQRSRTATRIGSGLRSP